MASPRSGLLGLVLAAHPVPTVGVTALVTVLAAVAGNSSATVALVGAAVLSGQLSIGWCNDLIDAGRDSAAQRSDKPLAVGVVSMRAVRLSTAAAVAAMVLLSLALGWRAGVVHLVAVGSGWAYNFGLKSTAMSVAPYVVTFGLFPAVATLPLPEHPWPPSWVMLAGALIGVAAHFGNVAPDIAEDSAVGVRGLPHLLGRLRSGIAACAAGLAAIAVVVAGEGSSHLGGLGWLEVTAAIVVSAGALVAVRRDPHSEAAFYGSMLVAALGVALIARSGSLS